MKFKTKALAAVLANLCLIGVARPAYEIPIYNSNGDLFAYVTVVESIDTLNPDFLQGSEVRELYDTELEGIITALVWHANLLGTPALVPKISLYPLDAVDSNASATSQYMEDGLGSVLYHNIVLGEDADDSSLLFDFNGGSYISVDLMYPFYYNNTVYNTVWSNVTLNPLAQNGMLPNLSATIVHELVHALGMNAMTGSDDDDDDDDDGDSGGDDDGFYFSDTSNPYTSHLVDAFGTKASAGMDIQLVDADDLGSAVDSDVFYIVYNEERPDSGGVSFVGDNVQEVIGKDTVIYMSDLYPIDEDGNLIEATVLNSVTGGIPINAVENDEDGLSTELSHLELQNSLLSHQDYRNWTTLMEAEYALLQDLGYDIDRKRYFGTSIYASGQDVTITQAFGQRENFEWTGEPSTQSTAIGVHIYGSLNTVLVDADQRADGDESIGIRVDGYNNDLTIASGRLISANGTNGRGIAVTYGMGHTLTIEVGATVQATGEDGKALSFDFGSNIFGDYREYRGSWIRATSSLYTLDGDYVFMVDSQFLNNPLDGLDGSLVDSVVISGTLDAGDGQAIYISRNSHVGEIVITESASIQGDIVSEWNALGTIYSTTIDEETVYYLELDVDYPGYEDMFKAQVAFDYEEYGAVGAPDVTTNIIFTSSSEDSLFSYSGDIDGANGIRLTVDSGSTELTGTANVLGVNIKEDGELLGSATYNLTAIDTSGGATVVNTDDSMFLQGALVNEGTLYSTTLTGMPTINGNYVQAETGDLVLDIDKEGQVTPLSVSGESAFVSGSTVSLILEPDYYESGTTVDSNGLTASDIVTGELSTTADVTIGFDTDLLAEFSPTLEFSESDGVLTISRASDAYSQYATGGWQSQIASILDNNVDNATDGNAQALYALLDFSAADGSGVRSAVTSLGGDSFLQTVRSDFAFERAISRVVETGFDSLHEGKDVWVLPFGGRMTESYGDSHWRTKAMGVATGVKIHDGKQDYGFHLVAGYLKKTDDYNGKTKSGGLWIGGSYDRRLGDDDSWLTELRARVGFVHAKDERSIDVLSRRSYLTSNGMQYNLTVSGKIGPVFQLANSAQIMPYVGLAGTLIYKPSKSESGFGALDVDDRVYRSLRTEVGVKAKTPQIKAIDADYAWSFGGKVAYERELLNKAGDFKASIVGMSGTFERSVEWEGKDRGIVGAHVELGKSKTFAAKLGVDTEFSKAGNAIVGYAKAEWKF